MKKLYTLISLIILSLFPLHNLLAWEFNNTYPFGEQPAGTSPDYYESDPYGWAKWNCTSYAGWKVRESYFSNFINSFTHNNTTVVYGHAENWDNAASSQGITVSSTPVLHSAGIWEAYQGYAGSENPFGHVAWVERVNGDGSIVFSQYNANWSGAYSEVTLSGSLLPSKYIVFGSSGGGGSNCSVISNKTVGSGQTFNCSASSIQILPETNFSSGSNVNLQSI